MDSPTGGESGSKAGVQRDYTGWESREVVLYRKRVEKKQVNEFWKSKEFWAAVFAELVAFGSLAVRQYVPEVHQGIVLAAFGVFQTIALAALGARYVVNQIEFKVRQEIQGLEVRMRSQKF